MFLLRIIMCIHDSIVKITLNMNRQNIKSYLPASVINARRFVLRKARRFKKYLHNYGKSYFYKIKTKNESFYIQINPYANGCVDEIVESEGVWEPGLLNTLKHILKDGDTFIDIGANIGYHSIAIASALPEVKVYSFEPQNSLCKQIESSIEKNNLKNVTLFQVGLSDEEEEVLIHIPEENVGGSSVIKGLNNHAAFKKSTKIKLETLDSYLSQLSRVDVIKIDVEGHEPEALKGGFKLLSKYKPIIVMEFSPIIYNYFNPKASQELLELLAKLNYELLDLDLNRLDIRAWLKTGDNATKGQIDIVCMSKK